jgi:hypothetical protein
MHRPKLACPSFLSNPKPLKEFALDHSFDGIDWTLRPEDFVKTSSDRRGFMDALRSLHPLEVRYHCFFVNNELGDQDPVRAKAALKLFHDACLLVSRVGGRFITVHVGLGRDSCDGLSWDSTIVGLRRVANFADNLGLRVCLENLASGWTSKPELFAALLRDSGCRGTLDVGHARVCTQVVSGGYAEEDFTLPQPELFRNAHVYHEEDPIRGHVPPKDLADIENRLRLLRRLPLCDWWVLELRTAADMLQTLSVTREFFESEVTRKAV